MSFPVCWNITGECNKQCLYCFRELCETAQSLQTNIDVLNNLKKKGVTRITFSGGEPFMYPNITELIERAHKLGIQCYIITNGSILNADNCLDYLKYIERLSFSCDSPNPLVNDASGRSKDSYEHIKQVLPYIREHYSQDKLDIQINTVITSDKVFGYTELDSMFNAINNELYKYDISTWKIIRFYPLRGLAKENKDRLNISNSVFRKIKSEVKQIKAPFKIDVRNISDMDKRIIVSPYGYMKQTNNGVETILEDLKVVDCKSYQKGGVKHV